MVVVRLLLSFDAGLVVLTPADLSFAFVPESSRVGAWLPFAMAAGDFIETACVWRRERRYCFIEL